MTNERCPPPWVGTRQSAECHPDREVNKQRRQTETSISASPLTPSHTCFFCLHKPWLSKMTPLGRRRKCPTCFDTPYHLRNDATSEGDKHRPLKKHINLQRSPPAKQRIQVSSEKTGSCRVRRFTSKKPLSASGVIIKVLNVRLRKKPFYLCSCSGFMVQK